jgi:hypothetical protein
MRRGKRISIGRVEQREPGGGWRRFSGPADFRGTEKHGWLLTWRVGWECGREWRTSYAAGRENSGSVRPREGGIRRG